MYCGSGNIWNPSSIDIDKSFISIVVENLSYEKNDPELRTIEDAMHRFDWMK